MYLPLLWLGKVIHRTSRLFHNSGAALPGYVIERLSPRFLEKALKRLPDGVVVISGTNGKTTTTKIVADTLHALGEKVMTNRTGSNMTRGLISMIVSRSTLSGQLPFDVAVLEVDEAYAAVLAKKVPIRGALVLNIMRDQLDRFGEIDTTAKMLGELTRASNSIVILNGNDRRVRNLPVKNGVEVHLFVVNHTTDKLLKTDDEWHGKKHTSQVAVDGQFVLEESENRELIINNNKVLTHFEGAHNHLNFTAAFGLLSLLKPKTSSSEILTLMSRVKPAFGRGERIKVGKSTFDILLVKNPSSFVQTVKGNKLEDYATSTVIINDAYADSRDVSWLWDVEVDDFKRSKKVYTGGTRGYDMAVRLKYADVSVKEVLGKEKDIIKVLSSIPGVHAVFCTYTAMLTLRKELVRLGHTEQVV